MRRALTLLLCGATALTLGACSDAPEPIPFDAATWRSAGPGDTTSFTTRGRMQVDLAERVLSVGTPRGEVLDLLGEPDQPPSATEVVYYLGRSDSFLGGPSFLVLTFEREKLARVRIAVD